MFVVIKGRRWIRRNEKKVRKEKREKEEEEAMEGGE